MPKRHSAPAAASPKEQIWPTTTSVHSARVLTIKQVQALTSLSRASIFRSVAKGTFPAAIGLSAGGKRFRIGWREMDVCRWLADPASWRSPTT